MVTSLTEMGKNLARDGFRGKINVSVGHKRSVQPAMILLVEDPNR